MDDEAPFAATVREAAAAPELKPQLRALLHYHCGVHTLRTRQLMIDLQATAMSSTALSSVNVNKVALVRNTRHLGIPSVTRAAVLCLRRARTASRCTRGRTPATSAPKTCTNCMPC
jgi:hypothetical protein